MVKTFRYTREMIEFLHQGFMQMPVSQLTEQFNARFGFDKSVKAIASALKSRSIKCGRTTGQLNKGVLRAFTQEQKQWCIENYPIYPRRELTAEFNRVFNENRSLTQVVAFLKNHKITSGKTGRFEKGQKSWNTGTKGVMKANNTSFKKGDKPANWMPIGSERIVDEVYTEVKVAEHLWIAKARIIWQQLHGEIPAGHNVRFKNGNPVDFNPDNLFLVSNAEHQLLNNMQFKHHPDETKDTLILIAKVQAKRSTVMRKQA